MSVPASQSRARATLDSQNLPRRVRDLLKSTLKIAGDELQRGLSASAREFEVQIHRQLDSSMDKTVRQRWHQSQELIERSRSDLLLHFMNSLESELANLRQPHAARGHLLGGYREGLELSLVNESESEETSVLTDAASRAELQNSLPLFLLGQRFGVLGGRPAYDAETLPIGPQALCRSLREAAERIGLHAQVRLTFYRAFDRQVMPNLGTLIEAINADLARNGVLPHLQYVPVRARRTEQRSGAAFTPPASERNLSLAESQAVRTARSEARNRLGTSEESAASHADNVRQAAEMLLAMAAGKGEQNVDDGIALLRQLTASRRQLLQKLNPERPRDGQEAPQIASASAVQQALRNLQNRPASSIMSRGRISAPNVGHLKQDLLALLRQSLPNQEAPALADEHNDALDLVGMLYDNVLKEIKPGSPGSALLAKLQVPLMRVAVQDSAFFTRQDHPARQLLNSIAETGARWLGEEDADSSLANQINSIVERTVQSYQGDPSVFKQAMSELNGHLQSLTRKAEVAERRHVDAARGKEKLTLARDHASRSIDALIKNQKLPRFTRTMLSQAWTDVLALTALRHGDDSEAWQQQLQAAEKLIDLSQNPASQKIPPELEVELQRELEEGLTKVGYQGDDVSAIASRLLHPDSASKDEASSRTELTMRLKARARLGEDLPGKRARRTPLTQEEEFHMLQVQQAPVGTWFEFVINPEGDRVRRRLSWLSTETGDALFVNQRGQKNAEYTLDSLARMLAKGQVRMVEEDQASIIDRAWENVLTALRSFEVPAESGAAR